MIQLFLVLFDGVIYWIRFAAPEYSVHTNDGTAVLFKYFTEDGKYIFVKKLTFDDLKAGRMISYYSIDVEKSELSPII